MAKFRTGITRSRTGCLTCRGRHIKCDEVKPVCGMCARLNLHCEEYSPTLVFRDDTLTVKRRSQMLQEQRWAAIRAQDQQREMRRRRRRENESSTDCTSSMPDSGPWPTQRPAERQDHQQSPLPGSPGQYSGTAMYSEAQASTVSKEIGLQSASPSENLGLDSGHFEEQPSVSEALMLANLSAVAAAAASPDQEPEQEENEDRARRGSNASPQPEAPQPQPQQQPRIASVSVGQSSPGSDEGSAEPADSSTSRPSQLSYWDNPVTTESLLSHTSTLDTDIMMPTYSPAELDDWWLHRSDMPGLPTVYKHIWDSFGQSNEALKYALLALMPVSLPNHRYSTTERSRRIECYSMALRAMTQTRQASSKIIDISIELTILSLFLLLEMQFGTFRGGIAHCTQSDFLVTQNYGRLSEWHIGRELLCTWICTRSWYYAQSASWRAAAAGPSEPLRQLLTPILRTSPKRSHPLIPLLCQCWHTSEQVILARLIGVNGKWPGFRYWCRQLESLRQQPPSPDAGMYGDPDVTEEQRLVQLADLRAELDDWHATLTIHDFPMLSATSESMAELDRQPRALRGEPLCFRNHQAALNYLRYAAAQALCSKETIAELTGGAFDKEPQPNPWINLCLRIIAGLDRPACLEGGADQIGLMWIVTHVVIWRGSLDMTVIEAIESWLPWLEEVGAIPGSTCPPWCLRGLLSKIRGERARGRHMLACSLDVESSSEWMDVYSRCSSGSGKLLVVGRVMETGLSFHEIAVGF